MMVLKIILGIIGLMIIIFLFIFIVIGFQYLVWFNWRHCKHCGHTLEYKGLKEDKDEGHYLFHCPHCGAWEQIPREEFFRQHDCEHYPNEIQV